MNITIAGKYRQAILDSLQEQLAGIDKAKQANIESLEKQRETSIESINKQQEAVKALNDSLIELQNAIKNVRNSLASDIAKLSKDMGMPGTSTKEQL